jgi:hypothetical protein
LLTDLAETPPAARDRLEILETIRSHAATIDVQYTVRHAGKPLPLGPAERNAFTHAQALWRAFSAAYLDCFEASLEAVDLVPYRALCLARAGGHFCDALKGHYRAGQSGTSDLIEDLQRLVELAGEYGLADTKVRDSLHPRGATSVTHIYRRALLISLAGDLQAGRERDALFELATCWEGKLTCSTWSRGARREPGDAHLPLVDGEPKRRMQLMHLGRWTHLVDLSRLSRSIARRMRKVEAGVAFEDLDLPESSRLLPAGDLLARAREAWCEERDPPELRELVAPTAATGGQGVSLSFAGNDFEAMYYMIAGEPFGMNQAGDTTSRRSFDEIFVFQHVALARGDTLARDAIRQFEDWEIVARNDDGFRLRRTRAGARFRGGQLVAMRLRHEGDDGPVTMGQVRWLLEPPFDGRMPGAIHAGVEMLKGKPHAIGVRDGRQSQPWCAGFRLGSLHANESITLILPSGWFKANRLVETRDAGIVYRLRINALRRRGRDFEEVEASIAT